MTEENENKHDKLARRVEDVAMTTSLVSAAVGVGASVVAPTGLTAVGIALGITSAPFIVTAACCCGCSNSNGSGLRQRVFLCSMEKSKIA